MEMSNKVRSELQVSILQTKFPKWTCKKRILITNRKMGTKIARIKQGWLTGCKVYTCHSICSSSPCIHTQCLFHVYLWNKCIYWKGLKNMQQRSSSLIYNSTNCDYSHGCFWISSVSHFLHFLHSYVSVLI